MAESWICLQRRFKCLRRARVIHGAKTILPKDIMRFLFIISHALCRRFTTRQHPGKPGGAAGGNNDSVPKIHLAKAI